MRDVGPLELLRGSLHIPELRSLMSCVCANEHGSANVVKVYMEKMALKMEIKLP